MNKTTSKVGSGGGIRTLDSRAVADAYAAAADNLGPLTGAFKQYLAYQDANGKAAVPFKNWYLNRLCRVCRRYQTRPWKGGLKVCSKRCREHFGARWHRRWVRFLEREHGWRELPEYGATPS